MIPLIGCNQPKVESGRASPAIKPHVSEPNTVLVFTVDDFFPKRLQVTRCQVSNAVHFYTFYKMYLKATLA